MNQTDTKELTQRDVEPIATNDSASPLRTKIKELGDTSGSIAQVLGLVVFIGGYASAFWNSLPGLKDILRGDFDFVSSSTFSLAIAIAIVLIVHYRYKWIPYVAKLLEHVLREYIEPYLTIGNFSKLKRVAIISIFLLASLAIFKYFFAPDTALDYVVRGNKYFSEEDWDQAIEDYDKAIQLDENFAYAFYNKANALQRKDFHNEELRTASIQNYTKFISIQQSKIIEDRRQGHEYKIEGRIGQVSDLIYAYMQRAMLYLKNNYLADASNDLQEIPRWKEEMSSLLSAQGKKKASKNVEGAQTDFDSAIRYCNYNPYIYLRRGQVAEDNKDYEKAIENYKAALSHFNAQSTIGLDTKYDFKPYAFRTNCNLCSIYLNNKDGSLRIQVGSPIFCGS